MPRLAPPIEGTSQPCAEQEWVEVRTLFHPLVATQAHRDHRALEWTFVQTSQDLECVLRDSHSNAVNAYGHVIKVS